MAMTFHDHVVSTYGDVVVRPFGTKRGGLSPRQMSRAVEFISENLTGNPTIGEIAHACGMSSSYFARSLQIVERMAPHQWLTLRRVEKAKDLLESTALDLREIASACGFVDASHFSRVFLRYERLTPARWRRFART